MCSTLKWIERTPDLFQDPLPKVRYILGRSIWGCKDRPLETRPKRTSLAVIQPQLAIQARSVACGRLRNVNEKNLTTLKGRAELTSRN